MDSLSTRSAKRIQASSWKGLRLFATAGAMYLAAGVGAGGRGCA